jgi:hypothetical protein
MTPGGYSLSGWSVVEAIGQSISFSHDAPVLPMSEWWKQGEQAVAQVSEVPEDVLDLPVTPCVVGVLEGRQCAPNRAFC